MRVALWGVFLLMLVWFMILPFHPQPTQGPDHDEDRRSEREAWIESLHRAAPGDDWHLIERANWQDHLQKRNAKVGQAQTNRWVEFGSSNQAGRTHFAQFTPDQKSLLVGSAGGGLWKASWDGRDHHPQSLFWLPKSDSVKGAHLNGLALSDQNWLIQTNRDVFFTSNAGLSWVRAEGYGSLNQTNMVPWGEKILLLVYEYVWNNGWKEDYSLYVSADQGRSFGLLRECGQGRPGFVPLADGKTILLSEGDGLFQSVDEGLSWTKLGNMPAGSPFANRDLVRANDGTLFVMGERDKFFLYRSKDQGKTWVKGLVSGDYWGVIAVAPYNSDLVVFGGVNAYISRNGGFSAEPINDWAEYYDDPANKLHADIMGIQFLEDQDGHPLLFISTDGGTYFSVDDGKTFLNLSQFGMNVSQYYTTLTDPSRPSHIHAGAQDQGYQWSADTTTGLFEQTISGDYAHLTTARNYPGLVYSVYPRFVMVSEEHGPDLTHYFPGDFPEVEHAWLPFLLADPDDPNTFFWCGEYIYRYTRMGNSGSWQSTQLPFQFEQGGGYVTALAIEGSTRTFYAVTTSGRFLRSNDEAQSWTESNVFLPSPHYFYGNAIYVDPNRPGRVIVAGSGYSQPGVFESVDSGQTFHGLGQNMPDTLFLQISGALDGSKDLYAATEAGPYTYNASTQTWQSILDSRAPFTVYWHCQTLNDRVRFATHGRGVWDFFPEGVPGATTVLPHVSPPGAAFSTGLLLTNTSATELHTSVHGYNQNGEWVASQEIWLQPNSTREIAAEEVFKGASVTHLKYTPAPNLEVGASFQAKRSGAMKAHTRNPTQVETAWLFPGEQELVWDGLALVNDQTQEANLVISQFSQAGELVHTYSGPVLGSNQKQLFVIGDEFLQPGGYFKIESPGPIMQLRGSQAQLTESVLFQVESPFATQQALYLAHITPNNSIFGTQIFLLNPSPEARTLAIQAYDANGADLGVVEKTLSGGVLTNWDIGLEVMGASHAVIQNPQDCLVSVVYRRRSDQAMSAHTTPNPLTRQSVFYLSDPTLAWDGFALTNFSTQLLQIQMIHEDETGAQRGKLDVTLNPYAKQLVLPASVFEVDRSSRIRLVSDNAFGLTALRGTPNDRSLAVLFEVKPQVALP
ncbi:MAG: hypothetical protein KDC71_19050 [Acidobacteria bacterium]|nr:hypothetical protein [Acidobacteriota bacterium]